MNSANSGCAAASWRFEESSGLKITQMTKDRERIIKIRVYNRCLLCILNIIYCIIVKLEVQKWIFLIKLRTPSSFLPAQPVAKRAKCGVRKHRSSRIWSWYPLGSQMNAINKPTNTNSELGKLRKIWIQSQQLSSRFTRFLMFFLSRSKVHWRQEHKQRPHLLDQSPGGINVEQISFRKSSVGRKNTWHVGLWRGLNRFSLGIKILINVQSR